jgi:hypothetical protein
MSDICKELVIARLEHTRDENPKTSKVRMC